MRDVPLKILVPTALVAALVAVPSALPATAGTGTSQTVKAVLNLPVDVPAQALRQCDRNGNCSDSPLPQGISTVRQLELLLSYSYTAGTVQTMPDVTTLVGKLVSTTGCKDKLGVRIDVSGAGYKTSAYSTNVNGRQDVKGDHKDVNHAEGVFVERCLV